jgi:hypothetical protein
VGSLTGFKASFGRAGTCYIAGQEEERLKVTAMLLRACIRTDLLSLATPLRLAVAATAATAACVLALPVYAETVVYECKVSQTTIAGVKKIFSDAEREQPDLSERFAFNVPRGRGCIILDGACDQKMGRLLVEQDESTITAKGSDPPLILSYAFLRKAFYLLIGDDSRYSDRDDCHEIQLNVVMP